MKYDVITIGSVTHDTFVSSDSFVTKDDTSFPTGKALCFGLGSKGQISKLVIASGGGGTNAAVTFARQGFKTACIGVVGKDLNGQEVIRELKGEGIDTLFQEHGDDLTAYSIILVDKSGERSILSYKGEGQHFDADKIDLNGLETGWIYLNSVGGHLEILEKAVEWAVKNNVKIASNPGSRELVYGLDKLSPLFNKYNIIIMNQEEAAGLTGIPYTDEKSIFKKMDDLIGGIFIMTKGPAGIVASDGKNIYSAGVPESPVVERTGAGDAFSSGFVAEYARSGDITKAIQFGTANASSVVTQFGSKLGILKKDDWGPWPLVEVKVETL